MRVAEWIHLKEAGCKLGQFIMHTVVGLEVASASFVAAGVWTEQSINHNICNVQWYENEFIIYLHK